MLVLTTLTISNGVYRAYYSDDTSLIIGHSDAVGLSKAYNIRIENDHCDQTIDPDGCEHGMQWHELCPRCFTPIPS